MYIEIRRDSQDLISFAWAFCEASQAATRKRHDITMRMTSRVGSAVSPSPTVYWPNNEENGWPKAWLALQALELPIRAIFCKWSRPEFVEMC
jgi:hypothetical protein